MAFLRGKDAAAWGESSAQNRLRELPTGAEFRRGLGRRFASATRAAYLLGVSATTVWRWLSHGCFPNARVYQGSDRRTVRIPLSDLEALRQQGLTDSQISTQVWKEGR